MRVGQGTAFRGNVTGSPNNANRIPCRVLGISLVCTVLSLAYVVAFTGHISFFYASNGKRTVNKISSPLGIISSVGG